MDAIKKGFKEGVFAARQFGAEFRANPGSSSRKECMDDAAVYFGEGKTYATLTKEEKQALCAAFAEGERAERAALKAIGRF